MSDVIKSNITFEARHASEKEIKIHNYCNNSSIADDIRLVERLSRGAVQKYYRQL